MVAPGSDYTAPMAQTIEQLKGIDEARFLSIYESSGEAGFGMLDGEVAKLMKFRPHAIRKLPMAQRAKRARSILMSGSNAELAYELIGSYLLKNHKDLVTAFLDATGVKHDDGMIEDLDHNTPAEDRIAPALSELDEKFDPADITLYLAMCAQQWPQVKALDEAWRKRS
jgi:hypothetical protein